MLSKRHRLIWKTLIFCSVPVLLAAGTLVVTRRVKEAPYIPGQEEEGITRALDRKAEPVASGIRFTDVTHQAGIRFEHFPFQRTSQLPEDMGSGAAWGDYDGDGFADLFLVNFAAPVGVPADGLASSTATDRLFRNRGDGTFEDVTERAGVGAAHRGMGAAWGDFDSDGDLDLFVTSWGECILWENRGDGSFRDASARAGVQGEGFWAGASCADFDLDRDLDLYVCGYVRYAPEVPGSPATLAGNAEFPFTLNPSSYPPHPNRFFVNRGDGTFEERASAAGVLGEAGRSLSASWADFDADGLPDLYVANDVSDNLLYRNRGDGKFDNISYEALVADYRGAMGLAVGDWDGDLDLDLFITHWIAQENALYTNLRSEVAEDGKSGKLLFGDDADRVGLGQISLDLIGWGTAFVDLDNDGWLDLFVANGSTFQKRDNPTQLVPMHPHLYWNRGPRGGFFEMGGKAGLRTEPPGVGRGAAFADYDRDGDLDLVVMRHSSSALLFRNDSQGGHHTSLRLRATSAHRSGTGARIIVHAGGHGFLREAGAGSSYLSQSDIEVLVGLGAANRIDSLEISWLGGGRDVWRDLEVDVAWDLEEGRPPRARPVAADSAVAAGPTPPGGRRISEISQHAVVSDLTSALSREEKRRFWELDKKAAELSGRGMWAEAEVVFEEMSRLDPRHEDALYDRGNCLLELGRHEEAKQVWERLLQVNPASSRAYVQIGILHTLPEADSLFDLEAAFAAFGSAHRINREESRPLVLQGEVALARGDLESALGVLTAAHRMNPRDTSALYLAGYITWKKGDTARARQLLDAAVNSLDTPAPVRGVSGEGDTRSATMEEQRRQAARRRLFAECLEALRAAPPPVDPGTAFSWVDRVLARLPG